MLRKENRAGGAAGAESLSAVSLETECRRAECRPAECLAGARLGEECFPKEERWLRIAADGPGLASAEDSAFGTPTEERALSRVPRVAPEASGSSIPPSGLRLVLRMKDRSPETFRILPRGLAKESKTPKVRSDQRERAGSGPWDVLARDNSVFMTQCAGSIAFIGFVKRVSLGKQIPVHTNFAVEKMQLLKKRGVRERVAVHSNFQCRVRDVVFVRCTGFSGNGTSHETRRPAKAGTTNDMNTSS